MNLDDVSGIIKQVLAQLEPMFKPEMRLTFVARDPDDDERMMIVSTDEVVQMAQVIIRNEQEGGFDERKATTH